MFGISWLTGKLAGAGAVTVAVLAVIAKIFTQGRQSGRDEQKAKEAKTREDNLKRIKHAGNAKPTGSVSNDPNNRDNR